MASANGSLADLGYARGRCDCDFGADCRIPDAVWWCKFSDPVIALGGCLSRHV